MTMTVVGVGAVNTTGSTSVTAAYPSGYTAVANDLCVVIVASAHSTTATLPACSNYSLLLSTAHAGSTTTYGSNTGPRRQTFFYTSLVAGQAAPTVTLATGTSTALSAQTIIIRSSAPTTNRWGVAAVAIADNTSGTALGGTAFGSNPGLTVGDLLIQNFVYTPNTATITAPTLTATGATIGTASSVVGGANTTGNLVGMSSATRSVTAGTATAAPLPGATMSAAGSGVVGLFRVREQAALTLANTFDNGASGTQITSGSQTSGGGDAFNSVTNVTSGSITFLNTAGFRGGMGIRATVSTTAGLEYLEYTNNVLTTQSTGQLYGRMRFRAPTALPPDSTGVKPFIVGDSAGAFQIDVRLNNVGKVELRSGAGTLLATSTTTYAVGDWIDLGWAILNYGTTNGQSELKLYSAVTGAVLETLTSAATIDTLRAGGGNRFWAGVIRSDITSFSFDIDDVALSTIGYPNLPRQTVSSQTSLQWRSIAPSTSMITDDFNSTTVNTARWNHNYGDAVSQPAGRGRIPTTTNYSAYASESSYNFDSIAAQIYPPAAGGATDEVYVQFSMQSSAQPAGTELDIYLDVITQTLYFLNRVGYADSGAPSIAYNATTMRWWRIMRSGSNVLYQTSPDGVSWTTQRTLATPSWIATTVNTIQVFVESHRGSGTADYMEMDNFNLLPTVTNISSQLDSRWRSYVGVAQISDERWRSYARIAQNSDERWRSYVGIASTLDMRWRSYVTVSATSDERWRSRIGISQSGDLRWRSYVGVAQPGDFRWRSYSSVSQTTDLRWKSISTTQVSSSLDARWRSAVTVSQTSDERWRSYVGVAATSDERWRSRVGISSTLDSRWRSAVTVTGATDLRWRSAGQVSSTTDLRWRSRIALSSTTDLRWRSRVAIAATLDSRWRSYSSLSRSMDLRWKSLAQVSQTTDLRWKSLALMEAIAWPSPPAITDGVDGGETYNLGSLFHLAESTMIYGIRWRVPDSVETPINGGHIASLWTVVGETRIASKSFTPVPGGYQDIMFDVPVSGATFTDYMAAVYTRHYTFRTPDTIPWSVTSPSGEIISEGSKLASTTDPLTYPASNYNAWYYISPIVGTSGSTTPVSQTLDLRWRVSQTVSQATDLRWRVAAIISSALDSRWRSYTVVAKTVDARWRSYLTLGSTTDIRWRSAANVSTNLSAWWHTAGTVSAPVEFDWRVAANVASTTDLRWRERVSISSTLDARWRSASQVTASTDLRWKSVGRVSSSLDARWRSSAQVTSSLDARWRSATRVSSTLDSRWRTYSSVLTPVSLQWRSYISLSTSNSLLWRVYGMAPVKTVDLQWKSAGQVTSTVDLRYRIASSSISISSPVELRWRSAQRVSFTFDARWRSYAPVAGQSDMRWREYQVAASSLDARWRSRVALTAPLDMRWRVYTALLKGIDLRWTSRALASNWTEARWRSYQQTTSTLDARWREARTVSSTLEARWRSVLVVQQAVDLRWTSVGRVSRAIDIRWKSEALGPVDPTDGFVVEIAPRVFRGERGQDGWITDIRPLATVNRLTPDIFIADRTR